MGRGGDHERLGFDVHVPPGGYCWWYLDGYSPDLEHAITIIAFVGSVFSPRYYNARRRDNEANPNAFCALNVALRSAGRDHWVMTEFAPAQVSRDATGFVLGKNRLRPLADGGIEVELDDKTAPWRRSLKGRVILRPRTGPGTPRSLEASRRHTWWPIAPLADIDVELAHPGLSFRGSGYHDANYGTEPMESAMKGWNWARTQSPQGVELTYDVESTNGAIYRHALLHRPNGTWSELPSNALEPQTLPPTGWGVPRSGRSRGGALEVAQTLLDSPFYARSLLTAPDGTHAMHEALRLDKFSSWSTRFLLPFRMRGGW